MSWPLSQDYNEAIQSPAASFSDPELKKGEVVCNALGIPMPRSGNFADVYEFRCTNGTRWAIKCFTREVAGLQERYKEISRALRDAKLPFTVEFTYQQEGVLVRGQWYPLLKMQWVEGFTFNEFVRNNLDKPAMLDGLLTIWAKMGQRLRSEGIAHADLQHGNVLLVPGSTANALAVKLIDYDGMYVRPLAGKPSGEVGHPSYQHPQRVRDGVYGPEVDRFPLLLIAASLRCLRIGGKDLWARYDNGDNLLFRESDLKAPETSALFRQLGVIADPKARALVGAVRQALAGPFDKTTLLEEVLPELGASATKAAPASKPVPVNVAAPVIAAKGSPAATGGGAAATAFAFDESPAGTIVSSRRARARARARQRSAFVLWAGIGALLMVGIAVALFFRGKVDSNSNDNKEVARTGDAGIKATGTDQGTGKENKKDPKKDVGKNPKTGPDKNPPKDPGNTDPKPENKVVTLDRFPIQRGGTGNVRVEGDTLIVDDLNHVPACANIYFGDTDWTDYDFEVEVKRLAGNTHCALWFRHSDPGNQWHYAFGKESRLVTLHNVSNGKWRDGIQQNVGPIVNDSWYTLRVSVRGNELRCFVDRRLTFTETRPDHPRGCVGFHVNASTFAFRKIKVTAPDGKMLLAGLPDVRSAEKPTEPVKPVTSATLFTGIFTNVVDGYTETWTITFADDKWDISGIYTKPGAKGARFNAEDINYKDDKLTFTHKLGPNSLWPSGATYTVEVKDENSLAYVWQIGARQGTRTLVRSPMIVTQPKEPVQPVTPAAGFEPLFNGNDLTGWSVDGGDANQWRVVGNWIVGQSKDWRTRSYLLTRKDYADFVLRFEYKVQDESNGAVAIRAIEGEDINQGDKTTTPYFNHPMLKLTDPATNATEPTGTTHFLKSAEAGAKPAATLSLPTSVWRTMEVTVRGNKCTATVDGKALVDVTLDPNAAKRGDFVPGLQRVKGKVGFQINTGTVLYRKVEIKEWTDGNPPAATPDDPVNATMQQRKEATAKAREIYEAATKRAETDLGAVLDREIETLPNAKLAAGPLPKWAYAAAA